MAQPWRCLWRGSLLQITRTTPFLRITLQLRHIFFTEACTFISIPSLQILLAYLSRDTIRAREGSFGIGSTVTLSPGTMRM